MAQHQGRDKKQGKHRATHLMDSVSTNDEELTKFADEDSVVKPKQEDIVAPPAADETQDSVRVDTEDTAETEEAKPETPVAPELRSIPDSAVRDWQRRRAFEYANDSAYWRREPIGIKGPTRNIFDTKAFYYFIYIFFGAVLLFALYKIIADNNLRGFYRRPTKVKLGVVDEAELPEEDLDVLLQRALGQGEHRSAVRYYYLKTLRMLEARRLITMHIKTTDEEYARQLDATPRGGDFRRLMGVYQRVWFGKFPISDVQFGTLLQYFKDFQSAIESGGARRA